MSSKERQRKVVMENVKQGKISLVLGVKKLKVSYRQAKRIYKRYHTEGDVGLLHRLDDEDRGQVTAMIMHLK